MELPSIPLPLREASDFMEFGRNCRNPGTLRKHANAIIKNMRSSGGALPTVFPAAAYLRALLIRRAFDPLRPRVSWAPRRPLWLRLVRRLRTRWSHAFTIAAAFMLETALKRQVPKAAGWNDYYMVLWFMTGKAEYVQELYSRAVDLPSWGSEDMPANQTCRWMLESVRRRHADLDEALSQIEARIGVPLVPSDPVDLWGPQFGVR